jgi:hypothetical protein
MSGGKEKKDMLILYGIFLYTYLCDFVVQNRFKNLKYSGVAQR